MAEVVGEGHPLAKARSLRLIASARLGLTSLSGKPGDARDLCEAHGLTPPAPAAIVNATLARAAGCRTVVPIKAGPLTQTLGACVRRGATRKPALRHDGAHPHRAAQPVPRR
jgi:LysR family transcriptional regulator of abg operon